MPRSTGRAGLRVRRAVVGDGPALQPLVAELRSGGGRASRPFLRETAAVEGQLGELIERPGLAVLVAEVADRAVGMAVLSVAPLSSLTDLPTLRVDYVVVTRDFRRQGVGRALLTAVAAYAEEHGMEQVAVATVPGDRETNRFFARLGFAPVLVRRVITTAGLVRTLAGPGRRPVVEDLTRRRLLRRPDPAVRRTLRGVVRG